MCVRLYGRMNPVAGYFDKGTLYVKAVDRYLEIPVPAVKTLVFPEQITMYMNENIFAYFKNDKYKLLLWRNGFGSVLTLDDFVLNLFKWEVPDWVGQRVPYRYGGAIKSEKDEKFYSTRLLYLIDDLWYLSSKEMPMSCIFKKSKETEDYFKYLEVNAGNIITMKVEDDNLVFLANSSELGLAIPNVNHYKSFVVL